MRNMVAEGFLRVSRDPTPWGVVVAGCAEHLRVLLTSDRPGGAQNISVCCWHLVGPEVCRTPVCVAGTCETHDGLIVIDSECYPPT